MPSQPLVKAAALVPSERLLHIRAAGPSKAGVDEDEPGRLPATFVLMAYPSPAASASADSTSSPVASKTKYLTIWISSLG